MSLKVCMLCPFYPNPEEIEGGHIGGVERYVQCLSHELAKLDCDINVVTSYDKDKIEYDNSIKVTRIKRKRILFRTPIFPWKNALSGDFDILHTIATYPFLSDYSAGMARKMGTPSVLAYQFDGKANGTLGKIATGLYYPLLGRMMKKHTKFIAATRSYADASPFLKSIPKNKLVIIPNGVDVEVFNPDAKKREILDRYELEEGYVLFVGRLVPYKGIEFLVEAMKNVDRQLVIVGMGPDKDKLVGRPNVKLIGYVEDGDLPSLYGYAAATVLPSITSSEAFGITLVESMACGTPVVATDLAGVVDIAQKGGIVVPPRDSKALCNGIKEVIEKGYDSAQLHRTAAENFSWSNIAQKYFSVYKTITRD